MFCTTTITAISQNKQFLKISYLSNMSSLHIMIGFLALHTLEAFTIGWRTLEYKKALAQAILLLWGRRGVGKRGDNTAIL